MYTGAEKDASSGQKECIQKELQLRISGRRRHGRRKKEEKREERRKRQADKKEGGIFIFFWAKGQMIDD